MKIVWWSAALAIVLGAATARAEPRLPAVIGDHMVLQRGRPVPIWGWAEPGEAITVRIADARGDAVTAADGRWRLTLPPLEPGGPFVLAVRGMASVLVKDVLVGDVWLCSGQSNMSFALASADTAARDVPAAGDAALRFFTVPRRSALEPVGDAGGAWQVSTPETARDFSAVAYYFGAALRERLDVPIGLVHASWPGTAGEEWLDPGSLRADASLRPIVARWDAAPAAEKAIFRRPTPVRLELDDFELLRVGPGSEPLADFDTGVATSRAGGAWTFDWKAAPHAAFALTPGDGGAGWAARIAGALEADDLALLGFRFRRWGEAIDLTTFRGLRFRLRGDGALKLRLLQPSITDWDDYATPAIAASSAWRQVTVLFRDLAQAGWGRRMPLTVDAAAGIVIQALPAHPPTRRPPAGLFQGMIAPLVPYALRGVVWYQGESNTARAHQYRRLLPALIRGWRRAFGQSDLPFGIVQLPNYGPARAEPRGSRWAELREAQLMALDLPDTGLAVTIDQGDAEDVHPKHKAEVGRRLALWALAAVDGVDVAYSGPMYEAMHVEDGRIRARFRCGERGLASRDGGPLKGFAVAGSDRTFRWAEARIEGAEVVVWSAAVPAPVALRYAWADNPEATLVDRDGLPASPFRSDDWPGKTVDQR